MTLSGLPSTGRLKQSTDTYGFLPAGLLGVGEVLHGEYQQETEDDSEGAPDEANSVTELPAMAIFLALFVAVEASLDSPANETAEKDADQKGRLDRPERQFKVYGIHVTRPCSAL